jgi:hypothetical protein
MSFQPSTYSGLNYALSNEGESAAATVYDAQVAKSQSISAGIEAGGAALITGLNIFSSYKSQQSQQTHAQKMAEQQEKLIALQTKQVEAQGIAQQAAAALQGLATTRTLLIAGGVVLTVGIIGATIVAVRRSGAEEEEE